MFRNPPSLATILLIVNDDVRQTLLRQQLEALGYSVWLVTDDQPLSYLLQLGRCDLIVIDTDDGPIAPPLMQEITDLVAQGMPLLRLASSTQFHQQDWHEATLGPQVANAIRKRTADQLILERLASWQTMNVLDGPTLLFCRAYAEAQLPNEVERARRSYQPLTLILIELHGTPPAPEPSYWRALGAHIIAGVRQIDIASRFSENRILIMMPMTEPSHGILVAQRIGQSLAELHSLAVPPSVTAGVAAYPTHGESTESLLSAVQRALSYAFEPGSIISLDQL